MEWGNKKSFKTTRGRKPMIVAKKIRLTSLRESLLAESILHSARMESSGGTFQKVTFSISSICQYFQTSVDYFYLLTVSFDPLWLRWFTPCTQYLLLACLEKCQNFFSLELVRQLKVSKISATHVVRISFYELYLRIYSMDDS